MPDLQQVRDGLCVALSGWCLLATLVVGAIIPTNVPGSHTPELSANIAPLTVDFSDTALQQTCQCLVTANLQVKAYVRSVALHTANKLSSELGWSTTPDVRLPDVHSLLTLGVALRL